MKDQRRDEWAIKKYIRVDVDEALVLTSFRMRGPASQHEDDAGVRKGKLPVVGRVVGRVEDNARGSIRVCHPPVPLFRQATWLQSTRGLFNS